MAQPVSKAKKYPPQRWASCSMQLIRNQDPKIR